MIRRVGRTVVFALAKQLNKEWTHKDVETASSPASLSMAADDFAYAMPNARRAMGKTISAKRKSHLPCLYRRKLEIVASTSLSPGLPNRCLHPPDAGDALLGKLAVRIEGERALIGFDGLRAIAGFFVGEPEAGPGFGILVVDVERGVEILDRLVALADGEQTLRPGLVGCSGERIAINCVVEVGDRLLMQAFALIDQTPGVKGLGTFWIELDRLVEIGPGLVELALNAQKIGAAEIGWRVVGIGRHGAVEIGQRRVVAVDLTISERPIGQGGRTAGSELDRLAEIGDRLLKLADPRVSHTARIVGFGARRVAPNDVGQGR